MAFYYKSTDINADDAKSCLKTMKVKQEGGRVFFTEIEKMT